MKQFFSDERIARALDRANDFWDARDNSPRVSIYTEPVYRQEQDAAKMLDLAEQCIWKDAETREEDILPSFWPDFGTISTARFWGGEIIPAPKNGFIHVKPIAHNVSDLAKLRPLPFEQTDFHRAIVLFRDLEKRFPGKPLFIRTPDLQGSLNTLALVMKQDEMLCAFYDEPAAIHRAIDHITDTLIDYTSRFIREIGAERVIGNIWPFITLQATRGIAITQDYMPLVGDDIYREFELPRLKRIADTFGGVFIHCCGKYEHHLQSLHDGGFKIHGFELAYPQMNLQRMHDVFGNDIAYLTGVSPDGLQDYPTIVEYAQHIATLPCAKARFWFASCPNWCDCEALKDVASLFGR